MIATNDKTTVEKPSDIRLLLCDDDQRLLDSLQSLMQLYGYHVDTALGGHRAIEKLASDQYDILLLDLKMPEITGHDVMRWMNNSQLNTMTIVVSGESSWSDISTALRQGAYDYIKKPYVPEELAATVNNAARKRLLEKSHEAISLQLKRSEKLHRYIVNNSPDIIYILDQNGNFSFLNSKIDSILGYSANELLGTHFINLVDEEDQEKAHYFFERNNSNRKTTQTIELALKPRKNTHDRRHFEVSIWPITDTEEVAYFSNKEKYTTYGTARDITDRLEAEAFINFQAYHDLLTRLPNRALFKDRLSVAINHAERNNSKLAVMFIDLDRFKVINDSLGHTMGDRLLQSVSQRLLQCIRNEDTLSRFGGDEFTLLLPSVSDAEGAFQVAQKILDAVKKPFQLNDHEIYVGASIGIALYPESGDTMDALIKHADIAMYRVKNTGKDSYQLFSHEMNTANTDRLQLEQDLHKALLNQEFEVCYQPQVRTSDRKICGVEALIRWNHPRLGRLSPGEFIPIAEENRLLVEMDKLTLRQACRDIRHYHQHGMPDLQLSVNLSPLTLEKSDCVDVIIGILEEEKFPPQLLEMEITENLLMNDSPDIMRRLLALTEYGIHLALDDFGTGYSSLSYLHKLPITTLKIDRSFVHTIQEGTEACIVDAIVSMAHGLKMTIIAEGVESKQQLQYLQKLGCGIVQGYLFGEASRIDLLAKQFNSELSLLAGNL